MPIVEYYENKEDNKLPIIPPHKLQLFLTFSQNFFHSLLMGFYVILVVIFIINFPSYLKFYVSISLNNHMIRLIDRYTSLLNHCLNTEI